MSDIDRLTMLERKIKTIGENIDSLSEFLNNFDATSVTIIAQLQIRLQTLIASFANVDELFDEIQLLDAENNYDENKKMIKNQYFEVFARGQTLLATALPQPPITPTNSNNASISSRDDVDLAKLNIPTFNGNPDEWLTFKETFITMVHDNKKYSDAQKMMYLKEALTGSAKHKINKMAVTNANYLPAWELVQRAYEDKRVLISSHFNSLFGLPVQDKESYQGISFLVDEAQQQVTSLNSLGVEVKPETVVAILEQKLHKSTYDEWDKTVKMNEFPKLEDLIAFLYKTAARLSKKRSNDKSTENTHKYAAPFKQRKFDNNQRVLLTSRVNCPLCSEPHPLYKCSQFLKMSINERMETVKKASLCFACLWDHRGKKCKMGNCPKCGKRHNSLLHFNSVVKKVDGKEEKNL